MKSKLGLWLALGYAGLTFLASISNASQLAIPSYIFVYLLGDGVSGSIHVAFGVSYGVSSFLASLLIVTISTLIICSFLYLIGLILEKTYRYFAKQ